MTTNNQEKRDLERAAVKIWIDIYNRNHDNKLRLLYQRERPDAVIQDSRQRLMGVEITHLFYDSEEAKMLLGRSQTNTHSNEVVEMLVKELNNRIRIKESKIDTYASDYPISLLIRNASPAFGMSDILAVKHLIYKPRGKFVQVWFLSRDGNNEWLSLDLSTL
ncbi:hypothetical protein N0M98_18990 [Paenibacillus doosanensis]|uniref:Uncharacterized protein n=1 Tax=Paenibacillus konkukensis TaxID=2020716 RepID=A0ABY4RK80_9BACL|nr:MULTISPECIES: hypothetical protein [Paenibacillus]MCS7462230.1 hypothetical protein [Paenibacillus doosanensis]UQZ82906.1 hypothetical protein SK3146_02066 [Paenibacillus konkukensis]